MNEQTDNAEEAMEELEEIITEEDTDAGYDQKKIDEAFPLKSPEEANKAEKQPEVATTDEVVKRPPLVLQHVTLTYADGRTGTFTGKAVMTLAEHVDARLRLVDVQLSQPQVVKVEPEKEEAVTEVK